MNNLSYNTYLSKHTIEIALSRRGYKLITVVKLLKKEFGYKNGKEILSTTNISNSTLRTVLAYRDEKEYADLVKEASQILRRINDISNSVDALGGSLKFIYWGKLHEYSAVAVVERDLRKIQYEYINNLSQS